MGCKCTHCSKRPSRCQQEQLPVKPLVVLSSCCVPVKRGQQSCAEKQMHKQVYSCKKSCRRSWI